MPARVNQHRHNRLKSNATAKISWNIAEQLLDKGTVVWPAGHNKEGFATGPCLMRDDAVSELGSHLGAAVESYLPKGTLSPLSRRCAYPAPVPGLAQWPELTWPLLHPTQ